MKIAVVSDIHGNRTAFEAVLADLERTAPDLVLHGGDMADGGSSPAEIVDRIRDLGWPGVIGNGEEMLADPETLEAFARAQPLALAPVFARVRDQAAATRAALGSERLCWLGRLPRVQVQAPLLAVVHASPESPWRAPPGDASAAKLEATYRPLGQPVAVYGHLHRAYIRRLEGITVANSGSVSLPYDGDRRAAYLLMDELDLEVRRVEYDIDREVSLLASSGLPHAAWLARMLEAGRFVMP